MTAAKPEALNRLWAVLDTVTEPEFYYDKDFILTFKKMLQVRCLPACYLPACPPALLSCFHNHGDISAIFGITSLSYIP